MRKRWGRGVGLVFAVFSMAIAVDVAAQDVPPGSGALDLGVTLSGFTGYPEEMREPTDDVLGEFGVTATWWLGRSLGLRAALSRGFASTDENCCPLPLIPVGPGVQFTTVTANGGDVGMDFWNPRLVGVLDVTPDAPTGFRGWLGAGRVHGLTHGIGGLDVRRRLPAGFTASLGAEVWLYSYDLQIEVFEYDQALAPVLVSSDAGPKRGWPVRLRVGVERRLR